MFALRFVAVIVMVMLSNSTAFASTGANLQLTGDGVDLNLVVDSPDATFDFGSFDVSLAPLQTLNERFSYTVTVTDDGLPATRDWSFCTPIADADCGPAATGFEQSYASIWMGRDERSPTDQDFMISDSTSFVSFQSVTGEPGVYTGTLDYSATNLSTFQPQSATVTLLAGAFVDASTVPEPPVVLLLLAGMTLLFARKALQGAPWARVAHRT